MTYLPDTTDPASPISGSAVSAAPVPASAAVSVRTASPTPPRRRRRGVFVAGSALAVAGAIGAGVFAAGLASPSGAFADSGSTPAPTASASSAAHPFAGLRSGPLRRELLDDLSTAPDRGARAQKIATTLVDSPKLFAKLPASLQTDLTSIKNATGSDVATDEATVKNSALSGGYGPEIQKVAERIQTRLQAHPQSTATPTPGS